MGKHHKNSKSDWRIGAQKEERWKILSPVGTLLNIVCILFPFLSIARGGVWIGVAALLAVILMGMYLIFSPYFTIMDSKSYRQSGGKAKVKHLELAFVSLATALLLGDHRLTFKILNWKLLVLEAVALTVILMVLFCKFSREVQESTDAAVIALVLTALLSVGLLIQGNHYLNMDAPESDAVILTQKHTERGRKGRKRYYYTIQTEEGETVKVKIPGMYYDHWEIGEEVPIVIDTGAFGVEYAYLSET